MNVSLSTGPVWSSLVKRSWPVKALLMGGCLLIIPLTAFVLYGRGLVERIEQAEVIHSQSQSRWEGKSALAARLETYQEQVRQLEVELAGSRRELFDDDGLASLLHNLTRLGVGLTFEQVTVEDARTREHHVELPIQVQATGDYSALQGFLSGLAGLGRLVALQELHLAAADSHPSGPLLVQLRLQAYRAALVDTLPEVSMVQSAEPRDPFTAAESLASEAAPLAGVAMVGYLRGQQGQVALVRVGEVLHPLREGDLLGPERVASIDEGRIELIAPEAAGPIPRVLRLGSVAEG